MLAQEHHQDRRRMSGLCVCAAAVAKRTGEPPDRRTSTRRETGGAAHWVTPGGVPGRARRLKRRARPTAQRVTKRTSSYRIGGSPPSASGRGSRETTPGGRPLSRSRVRIATAAHSYNHRPCRSRVLVSNKSPPSQRALL